MSDKCWLVKQEPESYAWETFVREGSTAWTGVRNPQARNYLREMAPGDRVLFYHSGKEKRIVGIARVARGAYADPTAVDGAWVACDLVPGEILERPVGLAEIKADSELRQLALVRQSRLSVMPVTAAQFQRILALSRAGSRR